MDNPVKQTYNVLEVAEILGIGRNSAYEAANRGDFPTIKINGRTLIPKTRFHRWLEEEKGTEAA